MAAIVRYTGEVIRSDQAAAIDPGRLGECPRCGRPVIEGKRGYGCSGWRDGCPFVLWREHRDLSLSEDQVRELLQHRVLGPLSIEGSGSVLLHLTDNGALTEIPVPTGRPRGPAKPKRGGPRTAGSRKGSGTRRRRKPAAESSEAAPEPAASKAKRRDTARIHFLGERIGAPEPPGRFAPVSLGRCPVCGSDVIEQPKSYGCSAWKQGCRFAIWKTIAGKTIGVRTAEALLKRGKSPLIRGFQSKAGKPFEAHLKLEGGEVRFEFATDDRRRRPSAPDAD